MLEPYLRRLGFDPTDQKLYLCLARMGVQPASVLARQCGLDRVTAYKRLKKLAAQGLVRVYVDRAIQCFGIESFGALERVLREREEETQGLLRELPAAVGALKGMSAGEQSLPRIQVFEGEHGIQSCFRDVVFEAREQGIRKVRLLTTNTFEERLGAVPLERYIRSFVEDIRAHGIDLDTLEATGTLLPERLVQIALADLRPEKLPASRGASNILLAGKAVFLLAYREHPIGLKISQPELAQIFHFLFDLVEKTVEKPAVTAKKKTRR